MEPGQLDVEAFEGLAARGRRLAADGDLAGAVEALDRALGLWRGQPLDGITGPFAASERRRLTERRVAVVEERPSCVREYSTDDGATWDEGHRRRLRHRAYPIT